MAADWTTAAAKRMQPTQGGTLTRAGQPGMGMGNVPYAAGLMSGQPGGASDSTSGGAPTEAVGPAGYGGLTPPTGGSPSSGGSMPTQGGGGTGDPMAGLAFAQSLFEILLRQADEAERARRQGVM